MSAVRAPTALADPRVETLVAWAQRPEACIGVREKAALAALAHAPPRPQAAPALAFVAAAAYARVPNRGPRDLQAGHRVVDILCELGEHGARELVRLRERVHYDHPLRAIGAALTRLEHELRIPLGELEDAFGGPDLAADLTLTIPVGPFEAVIGVGDDLRHVRTSWRGARGKPVRSRPARAVDYPDALAAVHVERRRLQAHLSDLRTRLESAMLTERSWTVEGWAVRMFADPLRAALTRRLVWHFDGRDGTVLALARPDGLEDVDGRRIDLPRDATVTLWHPAENPALRESWRQCATELGLEQPIDQIARDVFVAESDTIDLVRGTCVEQRAFRGFLMNRGWHVPYLGPWSTVPEAVRAMTTAGPVAVLDLDWDTNEHGQPVEDTVIVGKLRFVSVQRRSLDARELPPPVVSEATRDVLGAVNAALPRH